MGIHIHVFNDNEWKAAQAGLAAAGHTAVTVLESSTLTFVSTLEKEYPDVYAAIKDGVATYKDKEMSGGDKAVAIAEDVIKIAPEVLTNLSGIKSALVSAVTTFFSDVEAGFKGVIKTAADKL